MVKNRFKYLANCSNLTHISTKRWGPPFLMLLAGCASNLPEERHEDHLFPKEHVYIELPTGKDADRKFDPVGWVKAKVVYPTLEQKVNSPKLCKNYYNKAAQDLLKEAKKARADAVIRVRSIVFFLNGRTQEFNTPECADDGAEGEILLRGIAIRYRPDPTPTPPSPASPIQKKD